MKSLVRYSLYVIFFLYLLGALFDVRGGYRSGDELGLLTGFADRGVREDWFDPRYWLWIKYVYALETIKLSVPLVNVVIFFALIFKLVRSRILSRPVILALPLMPTVFYFTNSYLRDYIFFLGAIYFLLEPEIQISTFQGKFKLLLCFLLVMVRPVYGLMLVGALFVSSNRRRRYFPAICVALLIVVFFVVPFLLLINDYALELYRNFFLFGHVRDKTQFTVFMIKESMLTHNTSPFIFCFAFLKFWFVPTKGIGSVYDRMIVLENLFLAMLFCYGFARRALYSYLPDRRYRMSTIMLIFSIVAAAGMTTDTDIYRFRIIFIIFAFYFACFVRLPKLQTTRRKLPVESGD